MNGITVEAAREAYRRTGLRPKTGLPCPGYCCAAEAVARSGQSLERLDTFYRLGFMMGFDGRAYSGINVHESEGYADGRACRVLLIDASTSGVIDDVGLEL